MENTHARKIKAICNQFLNQIEVPFQLIKHNASFFDDCCHAARTRGIPLEGATGILPYLHVGSDIATMAYGHLNYEAQIYIALYTAAAAGAEDACNDDVDLLKGFSLRFITGQKHGHPILDTYDLLLREMPEQFEPFTSDAMLQSALDFCVGLVLEYELEKKPALSRPAKRFPTFLRDLTGISRLYGMSAFPEGIPLRSWMESIPSLIDYVQSVNDIFSFYKEELVDESNNFISVKAHASGKTKLEVLQSIADETSDTYREITEVLSHCPEALEAFQKFARGYVYFHISCRRYRVPDLWAC